MSIVYNFGVCGASTADVINSQLPALMKIKPDLIILMVGTNDLLSVSGSHTLSFDEYKLNMRYIVDQIRANGWKMIFLTIPPVIEEYEYLRQPIMSFNGYPPLQRIIDANKFIFSLIENPFVNVCDVYALFNDITDLMSPESYLINEANSCDMDGTHPTANGYSAIGITIGRFIIENNISHEIIACVGDSITCGAKMIGQGTSSGNTYPARLQDYLQKGAHSAEK